MEGSRSTFQSEYRIFLSKRIDLRPDQPFDYKWFTECVNYYLEGRDAIFLSLFS